MANTKVQSEQIEDGSITADKLADGTIVAAELANNAVVTAAINADAVTGAKIADDAIDSEHYTDGSIDTAHIADAQITLAKMAANSIDSDQYVDGSIDTVHIADSQVTTAKIANGNISTAKIADNAVTSAKIDTNIDIAGTFDVTGATTLDSTLSVSGLVKTTSDVEIASSQPRLHLDRGDGSYSWSIYNGNGSGNFPISTFNIANNSNTPVVTILDSGNVGIGTTSPDSPLEIKAATNSSSDTTYLKLFNAGENVGHIDFENGNGSLARITGTKVGAGASANDGILTFNTATDASLSEAMRIDGSGNIGIGTANPSELLEVASTGATTAIEISAGEASTTTGEAKLVLRSLHSSSGTTYSRSEIASLGTAGGDSDLIFRTTTASGGPAEHMRITDDGNVGIGCVPAYKLDVVGTLRMQQSGSDLFSTIRGPLNRDLRIDINANGDGDALVVRDLRDNSVRFKVEAGGKVGIGTSPDFPLHVSSTGTVLGLNATSGAVSQRFNENGTARFFLSTLNGSNGIAFVNGDGTSERIRIDSSGRLLHQTTSASTYPTGTVYAMHGVGGDVTLKLGGYGSSHTMMQFLMSGNNAKGSIVCTQSETAYNTSSDYRLKENITPIENGLERLNNLKPVKFDWKEDGTTSEGFIAHEVQEIFPDAISGEKDGEDMQGMDYGRITPLLVKAIQEQQEQIEQLKSEIEALKS